MNPFNWSFKQHQTAVAHQQQRVFDAGSCYAIELFGSPGSGKTSLLEATIPKLGPCGVINGDMAGDHDIQRLKPLARFAIQVETGERCHLVNEDLRVIKPSKIDQVDYLFIENIGNLVCPAAFPVGAHLRVMLVSTPEGDDKIDKYPVAVSAADALLFTKMDLMPFVHFDLENAKAMALRYNPNLKIMEVSVKTGLGLANWIAWIQRRASSFHIAQGISPW